MLVAASFVNRTGMFVFPLLAVFLVRGKHLGVDEVGLLISIGSTGLLVGSLLSGPLCELAGRRNTLVISLVLNALGYLGLAVVDGPPWSYAALLFAALVGMGMFSPAANTLVADLAEPADRPFAYTVIYMANNLGMGVGPLLGGVAATHSFGLMFAGDIVLSLVCAVAVAVAVPSGRSSSPREPVTAGGRGGLLAHPGVLFLVLASFFYVVPLIGLEYTLPLAITTVLDSSTVLVGAVYTINSVVIVVAGFAVEKRIARTGTRSLLVGAGLLWAAGMALILFGFSLAAILLSTVVWTVGEIIVSVVVPTVIADQVDSRRVSGFMALNGFVLGLTRLVVPSGLGIVWATDGHRPVFAILLAAPLLGSVVFALLPMRSRPRPPTSSAPASSTDQSLSTTA
jgi:MFS family permease